MSTSDVVVADRYPSIGSSTSGGGGGSLVDLVRRGLATASVADRVLWISPSADDGETNEPVSDARLTVSRASVPKAAYDSYYLTVGAGRIWTLLHGIAVQLCTDALTDVPWQQFREVNNAVAANVARLAPRRSRVTVHDYTLLLALPEIRRLRPDLSLVYVHHTPWPHLEQVKHSSAREVLRCLARATASSDAIVVSAHQWKRNLETWSTDAPVSVIPPGIDPAELTQQALAAATSGYWATLLRTGDHRPVIAAVGRADPSKNFDAVLNAWVGLVRDGVPGTLCLHLVPTARSSLAVYRSYAEALYRTAEEANRYRPESVVIWERQCQGDALWLLQQANVVVACSRADGWNLVAAEAWALGPDAQRLILSSKVGAVDLLGPIARLVDDPSNDAEIACAIRAAIYDRSGDAGFSRRQLSLPTPRDWWCAILEVHRRLT